MMIFDDLFDEIYIGSGELSPRGQLLARILFGLLGTFLGLAGCYHFLTNISYTGNLAMRVSIVMLFIALSAFFFFNVVLARPWKWPGTLFILSFVAMFLSRVIGGP